jgi:phosphohistidine phosphatase
MKTLILMRHAKSSWKDNSLPDHQRPLNKRGKRDATRMGKFLKKQGNKLDVILCSTAKRAVSTVKYFIQEYNFEGEVFYLDDLYGTDIERYIAILNRLDNDIDMAMIVGHNPEMDYFLEIVCDETEHMPTASIAVIRLLIDDWIELKEITPGELINLWKPGVI